MTFTLKRSVTILAVLIAAIVWVLLGHFPDILTTTIAVVLLVCGLVILYLVNRAVTKQADDAHTLGPSNRRDE